MKWMILFEHRARTYPSSSADMITWYTSLFARKLHGIPSYNAQPGERQIILKLWRFYIVEKEKKPEHVPAVCGTCAFSFTESSRPFYECRLNPPISVELNDNRGMAWRYPTVYGDEWCGHWKNRSHISVPNFKHTDN